MEGTRGEPQWLVACLCAEWCGTCRDYRAVFEAQAAALAGRARFRWIDIEEHPEALDADDVENFPTLLVANGDEVVFFGPVTPHEATLARLLRSALAGDLPLLRDASLASLRALLR